MPQEPVSKRAVVFIDGQNLFHAAREAFGYTFPNFDPLVLAEWVCREQTWQLAQVRFYTGLPDPTVRPIWHGFWVRKLAAMGSRGVWTFCRPLRYGNEVVNLPDGTQSTALVGREKGVDIRLGLDVVRLAREGAFDVAVVFSQDQDLSEVADEVKAISILQNRWIKVACTFPLSPTSRNRRGINGTQWIPVSRPVYDGCLDPNDYRGGEGSS
jgi:uncharacterized LabA/DUF88 family protein